MNCESYSEANSRISLTCSHTDQFYLMKPILSYGTSQNPTFSFEFASGSEVTYNDTEITIAGVLSQALGTKRLTVRSYFTLYLIFVSDCNQMLIFLINTVSHFNHRHHKETASNHFSVLFPYSHSCQRALINVYL